MLYCAERALLAMAYLMEHNQENKNLQQPAQAPSFLRGMTAVTVTAKRVAAVTMTSIGESVNNSSRALFFGSDT
jgi:hypothetical protein